MDIRADTLALRPDDLLVLLPGAQMVPSDFWQYGFIDAVRQRGIRADIVVPHLSPEHVMAKTAVSVLYDEVMVPAFARGCRSIWLAGVSLGGLNALQYAARYADRLGGICLLAPYPGTGDICAEIRAHGGPVAWAQSPAATLGDEREAWRWLVHQSQSDRLPPVYFGTGEQDRFIRNQRLLAELIPTARQRFIAGGHDWSTWQALWAAWLDDCPLPRQPVVEAA